MHSHKLDVNERGQATRGRTPPSRKDSGPLRRDSVPRQQAPQQPTGGSNGLSRQNSISRRSSAPRQQPVARRESMSRSSEERSNKWQSSLARDSGYSTKPQSWKDSLRGMSRESTSPPPVRQQRYNFIIRRMCSIKVVNFNFDLYIFFSFSTKLLKI